MQQRKATFKLYPNATERRALEETLALHCRAYNALLEEHQRCYWAGLPALNFHGMCKALTTWRAYAPSLEGLSAQSLQVTAKRAALAFEAFYRRVAKGETPGFPRFKSLKRFTGWGYKAHADGWRILEERSVVKKGRYAGSSYGAVRLSGIGTIGLRGRSRFPGTPKTAEVLRKGDNWYLSVTFNVAEAYLERKSGQQSASFDWGLKTLLTVVVGDPLTGAVETVDNPRWLKKNLEKIAGLQQRIAREELKTKQKSGRERGFPVDVTLGELYRRLRHVHVQIARQRKDFYHKLTSKMVERFGVIVTNELSVSSISRAPKPVQNDDGTCTPNDSASKAELSHGSLNGAPAASGLLEKFRYKAEEAGSKFMEIPAKKVKPSQRCCCCGKLTKLRLDECTYRCVCGNVQDRDANAARTALRYAYEGSWWDKLTGPGTGPAAAKLALA